MKRLGKLQEQAENYDSLVHTHVVYMHLHIKYSMLQCPDRTAGRMLSCLGIYCNRFVGYP